MKRICALWIAAVLWTQTAVAADQAIQVQGGPWRLAGRAYQSARLSAHPHLLVVLHGDAPGINPSYQYAFAQHAAVALGDVIAVGLLRPGYADGLGGKSEGSRGWAIADNYTPGDIASVAEAVKALKQRYHAADLTLAGHSGGAALAADIIALYPHLAARALIVSCPCDVAAFRHSMLKLQFNPLWLWPVDAVSPRDHMAQIPHDTVVRMVVGGNDPIAPPRLTFAFASALKHMGGNVSVAVLKGEGHEVFLEPAVFVRLQQLMQTK
jgi:predicted esterase